MCVLDFLLDVYINEKIVIVNNMKPIIRNAYTEEGQFHVWLVHSKHGICYVTQDEVCLPP